MRTYPYWGPPLFEITRFRKAGGILSKRISLAPDGTLVSDGAACTMTQGSAWRTKCGTLEEFAADIAAMPSNEAITLGTLRDDLPDEVTITVKAKLNGATNVVARTADYLSYRPGQPALALIDIDTKGMPAAVRDKVKGDFWTALVGVVPELAQTGRVVRASTSSGISNAGSRCQDRAASTSIYMVKDGADAERFLRTLHDRCWLAGYGWYLVGAGGQLLERRLSTAWWAAPERLVFEGAPVLTSPLCRPTADPS